MVIDFRCNLISFKFKRKKKCVTLKIIFHLKAFWEGKKPNKTHERWINNFSLFPLLMCFRIAFCYFYFIHSCEFGINWDFSSSSYNGEWQGAVKNALLGYFFRRIIVMHTKLNPQSSLLLFVSSRIPHEYIKKKAFRFIFKSFFFVVVYLIEEHVVCERGKLTSW